MLPDSSQQSNTYSTRFNGSPPDGSHIVAARAKKSPIWELATGKLIAVEAPPRTCSVGVTPDSTKLLLRGQEYWIADTGTGERVRVAHDIHHPTWISPDNRTVLELPKGGVPQARDWTAADIPFTNQRLAPWQVDADFKGMDRSGLQFRRQTVRFECRTPDFPRTWSGFPSRQCDLGSGPKSF